MCCALLLDKADDICFPNAVAAGLFTVIDMRDQIVFQKIQGSALADVTGFAELLLA